MLLIICTCYSFAVLLWLCSLLSDVKYLSTWPNIKVDSMYRVVMCINCLSCCCNKRLSVWQKSEIDSFNATALDRLSRHEQTKASVTSAHSDDIVNVETAESCQCVSDLRLESPAISTHCQQHLSTSPAAAAASRDLPVNIGCCESVTGKTLSQLEDELDLLLSVWKWVSAYSGWVIICTVWQWRSQRGGVWGFKPPPLRKVFIFTA